MSPIATQIQAPPGPFVDADWLEIETTLTDPEVLAEPYTSTTSYRHLKDELREYICLENNHDSADSKGRAGVKLE